MKFVALAVAALVGLSDATRLSGKALSNQKVTSKLMQSAKLYDRSTGAEASASASDAARNLENNGSITAAHSIIFQSCESLTVQADFEDDGDDDGSMNVQELYSQGAVKSQKSYILFDVCLSDYCYSGSSSDRTTYIVDMGSFINAFAEFIPTKQAAYCEGCQSNLNYCLYSSGTSNNGGRKLADGEASGLVEYIDCDRCTKYGCFSGSSTSYYSLDWITSMTSCEANDENPYYYNGKQVTVGFMCNQEGTGVEVAAFLDDECTLYTNQIAYGNFMSSTDYSYWYHSRQHIEYMFNTGFSCYDPTVTYINPYDEQMGTYGDDVWGDDGAAAADDAAVPDAAEWCQNVFASEMGPITLSDCGGDGNGDGGRKLDDADADADEYTQQYTLAEEDIDDAYAVCYALTGLGGTGEHLYEKSGSGSMYTYYGTTKEKSSADWQSELDKEYSNKKWASSAGGISFFVIAVFTAMGVGAAVYLKKKNDKALETSSMAIDSKEAPLVKPDEKGELA